MAEMIMESNLLAVEDQIFISRYLKTSQAKPGSALLNILDFTFVTGGVLCLWLKNFRVALTITSFMSVRHALNSLNSSLERSLIEKMNVMVNQLIEIKSLLKRTLNLFKGNEGIIKRREILSQQNISMSSNQLCIPLKTLMYSNSLLMLKHLRLVCAVRGKKSELH